jgi:penicillin-binding protein 2
MRSELDSFYDKQLQTRIRVAYFVVMFMLGLLCLRLWYLQILGGNHYRKLSENNRIRIQKIKAPRGLILDSRGCILAGNRPSFDICLTPQDTSHAEIVLGHLADLLGTDLYPLKKRFEKSRVRPPFEPILLKADVSRDTVGLVLAHRLDLPGVSVVPIPVRHYPYETLACHLLGHLGEIGPKELDHPDFSHYKMGDFVGKCGVEQAVELQLKGIEGGYQAEVDAVGYKINIMGRVDPIPAHNVVLTIVADLQKTAEGALEGKPGAIVAIDPRNGRVLAMVSSPAFNPNLFSRGISPHEWDALINNPEHPLMNRCIQGTHPPGSTYKLITAVAALDRGLVNPDTSFFCGGSLRCGNRSYRCWKKSGHGKVNLMKGLVESCDVYFYNLGSLLGPDILAAYARAFGLGMTTGIALRDEKPGFIPTSGWYQSKHGIPWQSGETLSIAIGQGSNQVTPLQLVLAYAAIANGGTLYKPLYIDRVVTVEGEVLERFNPATKGEAPLSLENIKLLRECLWRAVNAPSGTGWRARLPNVDVAGKTGTAQVVSLNRGKLLYPARGTLDHAWFAGFAPKENARIAVVVLVEHGGHGGSAAAPIAKKIISKFLELEKGDHV